MDLSTVRQLCMLFILFLPQKGGTFKGTTLPRPHPVKYLNRKFLIS